MSHGSDPFNGRLPATITLSDGRTCLLRSLVEDDAEACCELLPKLHVETDFLNWRPGEFKMTVEQEREFIRSRSDPTRTVTVAAVVDGQLVALAGAERPTFKKLEHHAELGICTLQAYWGLGIGGHMMQAIFTWAERLRLHKINLRVFADNTRAHRWYVSLGFVEEGRLKGEVRRLDGTLGDVILMARYFSWMPTDGCQ